MLIVFLVVSFNMAACAGQGKVLFTDLKAKKVLQLEKELAYFYGAKNPELVVMHYMEAIKQLEATGFQQGVTKLHESMIEHLKRAYQEIQKQTKLQFNIDKAAEYEFELIVAQGQQAPFEDIYKVMLKLYQEVFKSSDANIGEAALLRTFLYKYKITILNSKALLSDEDIKLMVDMAKLSEKKLNSKL